MRIGYFADGLWAHRALEKIIATEGLAVAFIVARHDKADPVLREFAQRLDVPYLLHPDVNSTEFLEQIQKYNVDLNVSMSFNQILKKNIISAAPLGFINCHAGALPFYRGRNILNWAIINGEVEFAVTVHYVDEGIDTGNIILQSRVPITAQDDYASVLGKAYAACASTLRDALVLMIKGGAVRAQKQNEIHPVGFYCGMRREGDELIDWSWDSGRIVNFVRGISLPAPCARTYCGEKQLALIKAEIIQNAPSYIGTPGEVVGKDAAGIIVKTGDTTVKIARVADVGENGEFVNERIPAFRVGTRFGLNLFREWQSALKRLQALEQVLKGR